MAEDMQLNREVVLEADAETLERMRKEGHARGFAVYCDEGERIGGDKSAPPPLAYFGLSVGFRLLTQISRYAEVPGTHIDKAKVVRNAESGCYVIQTIRRPTEVKSEHTLNGAALDPRSFKK